MIVVVGGSLGGLRAAEQLRARGYSGPLRVVGDETHLPYNRPPLSKAILAADFSGIDAHEQLAFRQRSSVADVEWSLGVRVVASDLANQTVQLDTGEVLAYDGLVVATGLRARRLAISSPAGSRFVVRTLDDALALRARLVPGARVVVVGAGFIGCEVAATATTLGCDVTVIEGATGPMELALGRELSQSMRGFLRSRGVRFSSGRRVVGLVTAAANQCGGVTLDDGTELGADLIVEAIGSVPNTDWLAGNDLDLSDGVLCDERMRVAGAAHVVAVGDVARFTDTVLGGLPRRVEHWATAGDTAKLAAATLLADLAGVPAPAATAILPSFWTDLFELRLCGVGTTRAATSVQILEGDLHEPQRGLAVGYLRDDALVAVVTVGLASNRQLHYRTIVVAALV